MQSTLDNANEKRRRETFAHAANDEFAALRASAEAWKEELSRA